MLAFTFAFCGESSTPDSTDISGGCEFYSGQELVVGYGNLDRPNPPDGFDWVDSQPSMGQEEAAGKVLYFYATGDGGDRTQAESTARAYAFGQMAEAVKVQVIRQFAEAREAIGVGTDQDIEAVSQSLVATRARVEVQGALEKGHLTIKMVKIGNVDMESCQELGQRKTFFRCIYSMYIPYAHYIELRDGIVNGADRGQMNEQQQRLMDKTNEALASLDEQGW